MQATTLPMSPPLSSTIYQIMCYFHDTIMDYLASPPPTLLSSISFSLVNYSQYIIIIIFPCIAKKKKKIIIRTIDLH